MSLASMLRRMGEMGLSIDEAVELAELWEKSAAKAARGTSAGAARTRRWREKKEAETPPERHEARHETGHDEGHGDVTASRTCVRDISPDSETTGLAAAAAADERVCDWPQDPPGGIVKRLARMAGPGLADLRKAPGLTTTGGEIIRWKQAGCSWELDVVPVVLARTQRKRRQPVASWIPFTLDILEAKARREAPLPTLAAVRAEAPGGTLSDRIGAENAEARRRALARVGAAHG